MSSQPWHGLSRPPECPPMPFSLKSFLSTGPLQGVRGQTTNKTKSLPSSTYECPCWRGEDRLRGGALDSCQKNQGTKGHPVTKSCSSHRVPWSQALQTYPGHLPRKRPHLISTEHNSPAPLGAETGIQCSFKTALLRFNSHTIQLTHFRCRSRWYLVHSQCCVTIATVNFRTFTSPPKETPYLSAVTPVSPQLPIPACCSHKSTFCLYRFACSGHCL